MQFENGWTIKIEPSRYDSMKTVLIFNPEHELVDEEVCFCEEVQMFVESVESIRAS